MVEIPGAIVEVNTAEVYEDVVMVDIAIVEASCP